MGGVASGLVGSGLAGSCSLASGLIESGLTGSFAFHAPSYTALLGDCAILFAPSQRKGHTYANVTAEGVPRVGSAGVPG